MKGKRGWGKRARQVGRSIEQRGAGGSQDPGTPPRPSPRHGYLWLPGVPLHALELLLVPAEPHLVQLLLALHQLLVHALLDGFHLQRARERGRLGAGPAEPLPTLKHPGERAPGAWESSFYPR